MMPAASHTIESTLRGASIVMNQWEEYRSHNRIYYPLLPTVQISYVQNTDDKAPAHNFYTLTQATGIVCGHHLPSAKCKQTLSGLLALIVSYALSPHLFRLVIIHYLFQTSRGGIPLSVP